MFPRLRIDHLWCMTAVLLLATLGALLPIDQVDFWWHLALGRDISRLGAVPDTATQSWLLPPDTPFIYGSWLAEWLFFQLYRFGGLPLIVFTRNVLLLSLLVLVALEARRRSASWRLAALAVAGVGLTILNNVGVRPQIFAWLPFALTWLLLGAVRDRQLPPRALLALPLLLVFWVNVHGTFILGLGLMGLTALGESIKYVLHRDRSDRSRLVSLWSIAGASALMIFVNPYGIRIIAFVRDLAGNPIAQQHGNEWQPPNLLSFPGVLLPVALLLIALGWARSRRIDLTDALVLAVFTVLGISAIRSLIWFAIVAWPIAAGGLRGRALFQPRHATTMPVLNYGVALGLVAIFVAAQPPFKRLLPLPPPLTGLGADVENGWLIDDSTPVRAVSWLRANPLPPDARLFHEMRYGSYLMWALPDTPVAVDGRIELYPYKLWTQYLRIVDDEDALAGLDQLGATHTLLSRAMQPELITRLDSRGSGWQQLYSDEQIVIFERQASGRQP